MPNCCGVCLWYTSWLGSLWVRLSRCPTQREKAQVTLSMFGMIFAGAIGLLYVANSQEVTRFALNSMALSTGLAFYAAGIVASVIDDRG